MAEAFDIEVQKLCRGGAFLPTERIERELEVLPMEWLVARTPCGS